MKDRLRALLEEAGGQAALGPLARAAGVPEQALEGALVGDISAWTTVMVERLARTLGLDSALLWSSDPLPARPTLRFLRGDAWPDFCADDLGPLLRALGRASHLQRLVQGIGPRPREAFGPQRVSSPPHRQGYSLARSVRKALGHETGPIGSLHDVAQRDLDILVVHETLQTARLSAVTVAADTGIAVVINDAHERRAVMHRRSIAHELCHALFDPPSTGMLAVLDGDLEQGDNTEIEQRARAFSAEFLIPESGLLDMLGVPEPSDDLEHAAQTVSRVARKFGAPSSLTAYHLVNLGYVVRSLGERLVHQVGRGNPQIKETRGDWLAVRVEHACRKGLVSEGRAREILSLSLHEALPFDLGT